MKTTDLSTLDNAQLIQLVDGYQAKENKIREVLSEMATSLGFLDESGNFKPELKKEDIGFNDILKLMGIKISSLPMILLSEERRTELFERFAAVKKLGPLIEEYGNRN